MEQVSMYPIERNEFYLAVLSGMDIQPPDPVTRIEHYLQDIIDGNASTLPPVARVEFYLAQISGADVPVPDPITRIELYLAKIAGMEVETPEPVTRLEYWLQMWAEAGPSAVIETVTGNLPLTLQNALSHAIVSLTRYGLCTQDGTPTPDAPVDIVTNNGAIKLRRPSGMPIAYQMVEWLKSTGSISITGFKTKSTQEIETVFYRESRGSTYLYSSDTATSGTTNTTAYLTTAGGNWRWDGKVATINPATGVKITSVQNEDGVWINGTQYGYYTDAGEFVSTSDLKLSSNENTTVRIYAMTIREGETVTLDLVPVQRVTDNAYGFYDKVSGNFYTNADATFDAGDPIDDPVEIYTDGEDEVLTVSGENLLSRDGETTGKIINSTGTVSENSNYCISAPFMLSSGDYVCTWNAGSSSSRPFSVFACEADGTPKTNGMLFYQLRSEDGINTGEFTVPQATLAVSSYRSNATDLTVSAPQTASVPMLLGVGDYKDAVELINGIKTEKVGVRVFDGTEDWTAYTSSTLVIHNATSAWGAVAGVGGYCTHLTVLKAGETTFAGACRFATAFNVYEYKTAFGVADVAGFKAKLAEQYAAGTPVIIVYPLATETTEQTTAQHLSTHGGTNIVDSTANVGPVEAKVEYMASQANATPLLGMMGMVRPGAPEEPEEPEEPTEE